MARDPDPKTFADDPDELARLKRAELDKAAAKAGVPNPEALPNKDAVIEAIEAPNPALAPPPDHSGEPRERAYKVIGPHVVLGHAPGADFSALIPPAQEALLIESGHIERSNAKD